MTPELAAQRTIETPSVAPSPEPTVSLPDVVKASPLSPASTASVAPSANALPIETLSISPTPRSTSPALTSTPPYTDIRESLSPGAYFVYWSANQWFVQSLDGRYKEVFLPFESPYSGLSLSPDGDRVAFLDADHKVTIFNLNTGTATAYSDLGGIDYLDGFSWSPDGRCLYYSGSKQEIPFPEAEFGIYALSIESGEVSTLLDWRGDFDYGAYGPHWSPDGRWIAFTAKHHGTHDYVDYKLYVTDGSCVNDPQTCESKSRLIGEYWLYMWKDARNLLFICQNGTRRGPCEFNIDTFGPPRLIVDVNPLTDLEKLDTFGYLFSSDGKQAIISLSYRDKGASDYYGDIYIVTTENGQFVNVTNTPYIDEGWGPWSPDEKYILFERYFSLQPDVLVEGMFRQIGDLYLVPTGGGPERNLTNTPQEREDFAFWIVR